MGLFDDVKVERELPDCPTYLSQFQTKSLDCMMGSYTITQEGRLIEHAFGIESIPEGERKNQFDLFNRVELGDVDTNYHGWLNFYADSNGEWYEFNAKFTDGVMVEVVRVENK